MSRVTSNKCMSFNLTDENFLTKLLKLSRKKNIYQTKKKALKPLKGITLTLINYIQHSLGHPRDVALFIRQRFMGKSMQHFKSTHEAGKSKSRSRSTN